MKNLEPPKGSKVIDIEGNPESPINEGTLCPKGASLGGATMDNEENYLIKKLFNGRLGIVAIENQARM